MTVDEELVDAVHALGGDSLSGVVNAALGAEVDQRARAAALGALLAGGDDAFGQVPGHLVAAAAADFDALDTTGEASAA